MDWVDWVLAVMLGVVALCFGAVAVVHGGDVARWFLAEFWGGGVLWK